MPAVNSGRKVSDSPPRSSNVYISFETTSVALAERAREYLGRLEHRHFDMLERIETPHTIESVDNAVEAIGLLTDHVLGAPDLLRTLAHRRRLTIFAWPGKHMGINSRSP